MIEEISDILYQYVIDVLDGKIKACKKHRRACQRFLDDLDKVGDENFPYYFDLEELYRFYKWAYMFKHRKGILAGRQIDIRDSPFILFVAGNIFSWKRKSTKLRRYRKAYIQVARKNVKSQLLALIGSYENFLAEEQSEVYIAGWGREQSSIVYNEIESQINSCSLLKGKYTTSYGMIKHVKSGSFIKPLSRESRKTGDGTNPSLGIVDEYHCHATSEIYDVILSGMVARPQPLMVIITTAGFNLASPCYTEYTYVSNILDENSPIENDEYFAIICELEMGDDIKDETNWIKANPIVATYKEGLAYLRSELKSALDVPEKMRNFLTKNLNIWVDQKDNGYMSLEKWNSCGQEVDLSSLKGLECIVGVDLSAKLDLTSVTFEFKIVADDSEVYLVLSHSFMPEDRLTEKRNSDKVPYDLWVQQGWITATPGSVVDYAFVKSYIRNFEKEHGITIKEICADPWNALSFMQDMEAEGYTLIEVRQGIQTLGGPTKDFREQVYQKKVIHNNNPVLTWSIGNAITRQDHNENIKLDKEKSKDRIDPIASAINSHVRAMLLDTRVVIEITDDYLDQLGW